MSLFVADDQILSYCSICVLTYNRYEQLAATLSNIKGEFEKDQVNIIVLNNGSDDETSNLLTSLVKEWADLVVINSEHNLGCSSGRELLWRTAKRQYILSIDDDIILSRSSLIAMLQLLKNSSKGGVVSPVIIDSVSKRALNPVVGKISATKLFYEGCFVVNSVVIDSIGHLDSILAVAGEGLDYSIRLRRAGFEIMRAPDVVVEHVDRVRSGKEKETRRRQWVWSFSYVYFKNFVLPLALLHTMRVVLSHVRTGVPLYGWRFSIRLLRSAISGALRGRAAKSSVENIDAQPR